MNYYTGIGSRNTPDHILDIMTHIGSYLGTLGWVLRSGGADGADVAFEQGADAVNGTKEIYLPWKGFNGSNSQLHPEKYPFSFEETSLAAKHHPAWYNCKPAVRLMHQRNTRQILGCKSFSGSVLHPSKFVICWTKNGAMTGGTAQALRIAKIWEVLIINLGAATSASELEQLMLKIDEIQSLLLKPKEIQNGREHRHI